MVASAVLLAAAVANPYGICAHLHGANELPGNRAKIYRSIVHAGIGQHRLGIGPWLIRPDNVNWNFGYYDRAVKELVASGIEPMMVLYSDEAKGKLAAPADPAAYRDYIRTIVSRYKDSVHNWEIWNEANLDGFFKGANAAEYGRTLAVAYAAVKEADPAARVGFTGTSAVPIEWIREAYAAGGTNFDFMCVHPYTHPQPPEFGMNPGDGIDESVEKLRALMTEFGLGERPIRFTEVGWPTQAQSLDYPSVLQAGLRVARPGKSVWNVILADVKVEGEPPDQALARGLLDLLPPGSTAVSCTQKETVRLLGEGAVDAVVYPFESFFPAQTIDAVNAFLKRGGVLVEMGGLPCYFGRNGDLAAAGMQHGGAVGRFPFGYRSWWTRLDGQVDEKAGVFPKGANVFVTENGARAGAKQEPTGYPTKHYLWPDRIGEGAEWIPLVAAKHTNGVDLVAAAVVKYPGGGAAVLSTLPSRRGSYGICDEEHQAWYTARCAAIAMALGIEAHFPYVLQATEKDPFYSEDHFGLMHSDYQPKPAYTAYMNFILERPAGSVQSAKAWKSRDRKYFYPQWTRPDGKPAGALWTTGEPEYRKLRFAGPVEFRNLHGRRISVRGLGENVYSVPLSGAPVYFRGAELVK